MATVNPLEQRQSVTCFIPGDNPPFNAEYFFRVTVTSSHLYLISYSGTLTSRLMHVVQRSSLSSSEQVHRLPIMVPGCSRLLLCAVKSVNEQC